MPGALRMSSERMPTSGVGPEVERGMAGFKVVREMHLEPQTGVGFLLVRGQTLRVIDPTGEQVSDLIAFAADDTREWLSSGRTIDYANTIRLTTGHVLYSNRSRPMLTIVEDSVGTHDFLLTPCSPETFALLYEDYDGAYHPSCFENLWRNLEQFGIAPDDIPTTLNIFMDVAVGEDGELAIGPPPSRAGDHIDVRAEMDLVVGLTACSAEKSNSGSFKPIDAVIFGSAGR